MTAEVAALIQLVEDDRLILATLAAALIKAGYRVARTESLAAARTAFADQPPDLLVLDMRLPDGLGMELASEVRNTGVPVLFLTAYADQQFLDSAVDLGAAGYLVKPVSADQVLPMIATALETAKRSARDREANQGLRNALDQDRTVSLAVGVLMERLGLDHATAFERLRNAARSRRERLETLARAIVTGVDSVNSLTQTLAGSGGGTAPREGP